MNSLFFLLGVLFASCSQEGLSDMEIPSSSRNSKLNVYVELCNSTNCQPLEGKLVNVYQYEDEAAGLNQGIKLVPTDTSGIARLGSIELDRVFVTVRHKGVLDISQVSLPRNSLSHHFVTFVQ